MKIVPMPHSTVEWALEMEAAGGTISAPIDLVIDADGEAHFARHGDAFDFDAWAKSVRAAFASATADQRNAARARMGV